MRNIWIIGCREFNERVRKRSFLIATLLTPLLMVALMAAPTLVLQYTSEQPKEILVVDPSGWVLPALLESEDPKFIDGGANAGEAFTRMNDYDGLLLLGDSLLGERPSARLYTETTPPMHLEETIIEQVNKIIEREKLRAYNIENLDAILSAVKTDLTLESLRTSETEEASANQSAVVAMILGTVLGFALYFILTFYGAMVMGAVVEEKSSRILDVIVCTVRPFDLIMGKILGIAVVAITQLAIWSVLILACSLWLLPQLLTPDLLGAADALAAGSSDVATLSHSMEVDPTMLQALTILMDAGYLLKIICAMFLFMTGGYLLYSALFAAVGSLVDNTQDGAQFQLPIMAPLFVAMMGMLVAMEYPDSGLVYWLSMIPFTSPVVMMARVPYGVANVEIALSLVLLYGSFIGAVWVASRIYRIGIFMHGKKPTFGEVWRWLCDK